MQQSLRPPPNRTVEIDPTNPHIAWMVVNGKRILLTKRGTMFPDLVPGTYKLSLEPVAEGTSVAAPTPAATPTPPPPGPAVPDSTTAAPGPDVTGGQDFPRGNAPGRNLTKDPSLDPNRAPVPVPDPPGGVAAVIAELTRVPGLGETRARKLIGLGVQDLQTLSVTDVALLVSAIAVNAEQAAQIIAGANAIITGQNPA